MIPTLLQMGLFAWKLFAKTTCGRNNDAGGCPKMKKIREYFEWYPWTLSPTSMFIILSSTLGQQMVNCWFGLVVWIPGIPLWKRLLLKGTLRIPNHQPKPTTNYYTEWIWMDAKNWIFLGLLESMIFWRCFLVSVFLWTNFGSPLFHCWKSFSCWRPKRSSSQRILAFLCCFFFKRYVSANG